MKYVSSSLGFQDTCVHWVFPIRVLARVLNTVLLQSVLSQWILDNSSLNSSYLIEACSKFIPMENYAIYRNTPKWLQLSWMCNTANTVLTQHAQKPDFSPQKHIKAGMVIYISKASTREVEAGRLGVQRVALS